MTWEPVEYEQIFTREGEPLHPNYATLCEKWLTFGNTASDTNDNYEYTICRRVLGTEQPAALDAPDGLLIWWLSQEACEVINNSLNEHDWHLPDGIPAYIRAEFRSRLGRAGRGRLWVADDIELTEVPWDDTKPAARLASNCGGIVIRAKDAHHVFGLAGFLTDLKLNFINSLPWDTTEQENA